MIADRIPFRSHEVPRVMSRRVRLVKALDRWPAGTTGTVRDAHAYKVGFVVEVRWDAYDVKPSVNFEYFSKDEFERLLEEC